jgi:hypothetical protein
VGIIISELVGFQEIGCDIVFDVKTDLQKTARKAHFIAGGHTTTAPSSLTYLSAVSVV